jgi:ubiquinone/menaquinone biosynthesis C-methylase UbiE
VQPKEIFMSQATDNATYNDIAEWYDRYLDERPIYYEVLRPSVLDLAGGLQGTAVCDLACGQGWVARDLARRGARVTGLDLAHNLLALARRYEEQEPLGIVYLEGDAQYGDPLPDGGFSGCVCIMALTNIPDLAAVFGTVRRILVPGGWLVFAIPHPCFDTPDAVWTELRDPAHPVGRVVTGYFDERRWLASGQSDARGVRGRVAEYHRMLSTYLNTISTAGLILERMVEPRASAAQAEQNPGAREIPRLLLVRARRGA